MKFRCNFRPNLLTPRIASLLAKAGCRRIQLGIESASQTVLDSVKHGIRTDANGRAIAACREHGVQCKAMFIWGLPGDGPETAEAIVRWVESHRPDSIQVSCLVPLPGSPFWDEGDHRHVTEYHALSFFTNRIGSPPDELSALRDWILAECAAWTHIDTGLPVEIDRQALRANPVQSKPA